MTVTNSTSKITGNGNGAATVFSFNPIVIFQSSDIQVTLVGTDDSETLLTEGTGATQYSVTVASYPGTGSITYPASGATRLQTGESLVMKRVLPIEQQTNLRNQGGYHPDVLEVALDKLVMLHIQQQEEVSRSFKASLGFGGTLTLPAPVGDALLGWNSAGTAIVNKASTGGTISVPVDPSQGGTGETSLAAAFSAMKQDATTSVTGVVELATSAEGTAGVAADKVPSVAEVVSMIATHESPTPTVTPYTPEFVHLQERRAAGTTGPIYTAGDWRTAEVNTEAFDNGDNCTAPSSDSWVLSDGTYKVDIFMAVRSGSTPEARLRLYNTTGAAVVMLGMSQELHNTANDGTTILHAHGFFTIAASQTMELQVYPVSTDLATGGTGPKAHNIDSNDEYYLDIIFYKIS